MRWQYTTLLLKPKQPKSGAFHHNFLWLFCSGGEEEEQETADQLHQGQREAAEGFQGHSGQDQAAAAQDQGEGSGPAPAAVPVLRRAQAPRAATQEGAEIPQASISEI